MDSNNATSQLGRRNGLMLLTGLLAALALLAAAACGSDDSPAPNDTNAAGAEAVSSSSEDAPLVLAAGRTITVDDLVAAGWKKSKQYSTDTVPDATEIWYGFFNQKDVEVRFYATHQDALGTGVVSAEEATGKKLRQGGSVGASNRGAGSTGVTKYEAFLVAGNTVMLCELDTTVCEELVANVSGS